MSVENLKKINNYIENKVFREKIYLGDRIPEKKIENAKKSMKFKNDDDVIIFMDNTVFGSGKNGIIISSSGLYWKETFDEDSYLPWDTIKIFKESDEIEYQKSKIIFQGKKTIDFSSSIFNKEDGMMIVKDIISII